MLPDLDKHFQAIGLIPEISINYAMEWYMVLWTRVLPVEISLRVFDIILCEGYFPAAIDISITILKCLKSILLFISFEAIQHIFFFKEHLLTIGDCNEAMQTLKKPIEIFKKLEITADMFISKFLDSRYHNFFLCVFPVFSFCFSFHFIN